MKVLFLLLFSMALFADRLELELTRRWVNEKGWPIPDSSQMVFDKCEVLKDVIPEWICKKRFIFDDENKNYALLTNKIEKLYIVKNEIGELDIWRMDVYSLCQTNEALFYWVFVLDVDERDPETGITGVPREDIYADLDRDGIFESRFEGDEIDWALKYFAEKWKKQTGSGTG